MDPEIDKKGEIRTKLIEGFKAEKYMLKTQFTMTKFKINLQEVQTLQKYKSFEDYLTNNTFGKDSNHFNTNLIVDICQGTYAPSQAQPMGTARPDSLIGKKDS